MTFIGIDGCPGGWIVAIFKEYKLSWYKISQLDELLSFFETAELTLIDMPVGLLTNYRKGGRVCDQMARKLLPRHKKSSVFSAPPRSILYENNYEHCRHILGLESGGISLQSFHLLPKIREVDNFIRSHRNITLLEAHPELVFQNLGLNAAPSKKSSEGRLNRLDTLRKQDFEFQWPPPQGFPKEDCLDALALAVRAIQGNLKTVDPKPLKDTHKLCMKIHY